MRWGGVILGLFIVWHILDLTTAAPCTRAASSRATRTRTSSTPSPPGTATSSTSSRCSPSACTSGTASGAPPRPSASAARTRDRALKTVANVLALRAHGRLHLRTRRRHDRSGELNMSRPRLHATTRPASRSPTPRPPTGPSPSAGTRRRFEAKLVNPANRRKHTVIVVGTGLAGGSAGATLAEQGYHVVQFCYQDSPRRAHSIAAQGGINAAKNYRNDGDSVHRLFYDTVKGGDFRARESNVHRLAQISVEIIDQCVAQGVPFAREYGGLLDTRSFGGVQVSRTFYARGQTGQQLLLGAYQALSRQIAAGNVEMHAAHRDARPDRRRRAGPRHRRPRPGHRGDRHLLRRRRRPRHRRLRQRLLPVDQRHELQRHRRSGGRTGAARTSPTPASPRSTPPASRAPATTSPS